MKPEAFYRRITEFIFIEDEPCLSDVIFVPGNSRPDLALHAAELYHRGYAPYILPSGRYAKAIGRFPGEEETEWAFMRRILLQAGVPEEAILKEDQATFTWENAIRSRSVLEQSGIACRSALLCCQAFHAARAYMYYRQQFPDITITVVPTATRGITRDNWFLTNKGTDIVLGELERIGQQFHCMLPAGGEDVPRGFLTGDRNDTTDRSRL